MTEIIRWSSSGNGGLKLTVWVYPSDHISKVPFSNLSFATLPSVFIKQPDGLNVADQSLILPDTLTYSGFGQVATVGGAYSFIVPIPPYIKANYNIQSIGYADITGLVNIQNPTGGWWSDTIIINIGAYGTATYNGYTGIGRIVFKRK